MMNIMPHMKKDVIAVNLVKKWALDNQGQLYVIEAFLDANGDKTTNHKEAITGIITVSGHSYLISLDDCVIN